jgi:hypothetical protein
LLHSGGVHPSGDPHCDALVHAAHPDGVQYGEDPLHAAPPLQLQPPAAHSFVSPVHCELDVQLEHPLAWHICPPVHAGPVLQVQVPAVQVFASPPQSASVQHSDDGTHTLSHSFCPLAQPQPLVVHVSPAWHAAAPLHVHTPFEHLLLSPVHSESAPHVVHPDAAHTIPPPQAACPLQVQLPTWHVFVSPVQSALVQHVDSAMQAWSQSFSPAPQAVACASGAES